MTGDKIALPEMLEKGSDATLLRKMIGFAAQRLMELEVGEVTRAAPSERSPDRLADEGRLGVKRSSTDLRHQSEWRCVP
jgi:hypothetical protein